MRKVNKLLDSVESRVSLLVLFLTTTVGTFVMNWALSAFEWFATGGPKIWVITLLPIFVLIFAILLALSIANAERKRRQNAVKNEEIRNQKSHFFNPLEMTFENKVLRFEDLYDHYDRVLSNKTFKNCTFVGPGVMSLMDRFNDERGVFTDITLVSHEFPKNISAAVGFSNCKFFDCRYNGWTIFVDNGQPSDLFIPMMEDAGRKDFIIRETKKLT